MRSFYALCLVAGAMLGDAFSTTTQDPHAEVMVASVYHDSLHGCATAYGERYDKEAYTVAHKTIPNGSIVIIANPQTNRFVVAIVNDRGPFVEGRDIDLSARVARELEFEGVGPLLVEVVQCPSPQ